MQTFENSSTLALWLQAHQIQTEQWARNGAKSVEDLWLEVQNAESTLYSEPPLRRVRVVELYIYDGDRQLIEDAQTFVSGAIRRRHRPPSEKMRPDEDPFSAARRCLAEELGIDPATPVTFMPQSLTEFATILESTSYPGLLTHFTFYQVVAQVHNLPTTDFTTTNSAHAHGDPVVAHHWCWQARVGKTGRQEDREIGR